MTLNVKLKNDATGMEDAMKKKIQEEKLYEALMDSGLLPPKDAPNPIRDLILYILRKLDTRYRRIR